MLCSFEDGQPSSLLPAWLELGLQPARRPRSLRGGASPIDLPGEALTHQICSPIKIVQSKSEVILDNLGARLPPEEVLLNSEFLLPLDAHTASLHLRLLEKASK